MADFDEFAAYYEARNRQKTVTSDNPHNRVLIETIADGLDIGPDDAVLDVGCADGYILERLMDRHRFRLGVGIDISQHSIGLARQLVAKYPNISFFASPANSVPFANATFDKVVCNEVIEHVADDRAVLEEIARVCKSGARVYITAPNAYDAMLPLFVAHCRRVDEVEGHLRRYAAKDLAALAESTGFTVEKLQYNGFIASYLWYSTIIYNVRLKALLLNLITRRSSASSPAMAGVVGRPRFGILSKVAFVAMEIVMALDRPFRGMRSNMGFFAILRRR